MQPNHALSTVDHVLAVAERFFHVADLLHRRLNAGLGSGASIVPPAELYSLLVEEYGLRARAAILRNHATAHTVSNTSVDQESLLTVLNEAGEAIGRINRLDQLRSVIAGVSTLCVGISPGKGPVVDFLLKQLQEDLRLASS